MGSPITTWEGAEAYFTFADRPLVLGLILAVAVGLTVFAIYSTIRHEKHSYTHPMDPNKK